MYNRVKDLVGRRFGRLTVVSRADHNDKYHRAVWVCRCDCGKEKEVSATQLLGGDTTSCGCRKREWGRHIMAELHQEGTNEPMLRCKKPRSNNKTGVRGVCYVTEKKKYKASLMISGKTVYCGYFETLEEATAARKAAEEKYLSGGGASPRKE